MHSVIRKPVIELESQLDFKELVKVKIQHTDENGITRKLEVPISDGSSFKGVLYTICEFNAACITLNLTNGKALFNNFRLCLAGNAKEEWEIISNVADKTKAAFTKSIRDFKCVYTTNESKANLLEYIQSIPKPKDMDVHTFVRRLQSLNRYASEIPDDESLPVLTDAQIKIVTFRAMPSKWQEAFIQGNKQLKDCLLKDLIEYMENQKTFSDANHERQNRKHGWDDQDQHNSGPKQDNRNKRRHQNKRFCGGRHNYN